MTNSQLRLLLVAHEGADYSAVRSIPLLETVAYSELDPALQPGADEQYDALMLDGEWLHSEVVPQIAAANPNLPIILVARSESQEGLALASLELGADDYLMEPELTSVSVCAALRNARKFRQMRHQRDKARRQLTNCSTGVPAYFNERLRTSLTVVEALADTMDRQLDGHPAAVMGSALLDEIESLQQMVADVGDSRRAAQGNLILDQQSIGVGQLVQRILALPGHQNLSVERGPWNAIAICDQEKTVRAMARIIECVQQLAPTTEFTLTADEQDGRIGLRLSGSELTEADCESLMSKPVIAAGDAGFERVTALQLLEAQQIYLEMQPSSIWFDLPTNTPQLARRWTQWMCDDNWKTVTLFDVQADQGVDLAWADAFLHRTLTARDLVCPVSDGQWVVALFGETAETESRMRQFTATWKVLDAASELHAELLTSYRLPLEQESLERRLLACFGPRRILLLDNRPMPISPINRRLVEAGFDVVSVEQPDVLHAAADAAAIVGDAQSLDTLEELRGSVCPPNIPVFLVGSLKDQQKALQNNVKLLNENSEDCFEDLIDAIEQSAPSPYGRLSTVSSKSQPGSYSN